MSLKDYLMRGLRVVLDYIAFLVGYFNPTQRGIFHLPPITDPLLLKSALSLADEIREGKLKSEAVVNAYIQRIKEVEPYVNAVAQKCFKAALLEARDIDRQVEKELFGEKPENGVPSIRTLPLLGVPFTGKDSIPIKGMYWTSGLFSRKGMRSTEDAPCVENLKKAGAIAIALTNTPELCFWWDSENLIYGRTNNPYDLSRIPGGSSGGQGACLGYAGSVIGTGSDVGGSIRMPAFFCGVFGHKTTPGVVSTIGLYPEMAQSRQKYLSFGPMCRYACDLRPTLKAMAGENIVKLPKIDYGVDFRKVKVFYMDGNGGNPSTTPVDNEMKMAIREVAKHLFMTYGTKAKKVNLTKFSESFNIFVSSYKKPNVDSLASQMTQGQREVNLWLELFKSLFRISNHTLPLVIVALIERMTPINAKSKEYVALGEQLKKELHQLLGDDGIFLYPTHPEVAPKHKTTILKMHNTSYTSVFNILEVPITQCPLGFNKDGLPLGVQVVASPFNDHLTIALAQEIERRFGGWVAPCKVDVQKSEPDPGN